MAAPRASPRMTRGTKHPRVKMKVAEAEFQKSRLESTSYNFV